VFGDEAGERLAYNQADVKRQAWLGARAAAGAFQAHDVVGVAQHDVASAGIGMICSRLVRFTSSWTMTKCVAASSGTTLRGRYRRKQYYRRILGRVRSAIAGWPVHQQP